MFGSVYVVFNGFVIIFEGINYRKFIIVDVLSLVSGIDYLKEGLDTPPLGVWNFGPRMKLGVYFKNFTVTKLSKISMPSLASVFS